MIPWTQNPDWIKPIERELCGYVHDRYQPCTHKRPCPIHETPAPLVRSAGKRAGGVSPDVSHALPAPRFFDPWNAS